MGKRGSEGEMVRIRMVILQFCRSIWPIMCKNAKSGLKLERKRTRETGKIRKHG